MRRQALWLVLGLFTTSCSSGGSGDTQPSDDAGDSKDGSSTPNDVLDSSVTSDAGASSTDADTHEPSDAGHDADTQASDADTQSDSAVSGDAAVAADASMDAGIDADIDATTAALPSITSFSAPSSACIGSEIDLSYVYVGAQASITPGNINAPSPSGTAKATLGATTTYTLTVKDGAGGNATTMQASVTGLPSPDATVTAPANAAHHATALVASVPTQAGATYAWTAGSANTVIKSGAATQQISFDVDGTGTEAVLQVIVTKNGCASTTIKHLPMPCSVPTLISLDRAQVAGTPQYVGSAVMPPVDMNASGEIWAARYIVKPSQSFAIYDTDFSRFASAAWGAPASTPSRLNGSTVSTYFTKVAVDDAGDAVFAWLETSDYNNYTVKLRSYSALSGWRAEKTVGTSFDQNGSVHLKVVRSTGVATVVWVAGAYNAQMPHARTYNIMTDTLGSDLPLRASTTNDYAGDPMHLDFQANSAGDGMAVWFERDLASQFTSLYGVHFTGGLPDLAAGSGYDIKLLVQGSQNYTTDLMNYNSASKNELRNVAVSEGGRAAIVWRVYDYLAPTGTTGKYYARRYASGTWGPNELIDAEMGVRWGALDWSIDDMGRMLFVGGGSGNGYTFTHSETANSWAAMTTLTAAMAYSQGPSIGMHANGKNMIAYDDSVNTRNTLRAVAFDHGTLTLGTSFSVDDPTQDNASTSQILVDATGAARFVFNQIAKPLPMGANSSNSYLQYVVSCQ